MKQILVIDRFEGDCAVCECPDRAMENILRSRLPKGAKEGDAIRLVGGKYVVVAAETGKFKKRIDKLINDVWEK